MWYPSFKSRISCGIHFRISPRRSRQPRKMDPDGGGSEAARLEARAKAQMDRLKELVSNTGPAWTREQADAVRREYLRPIEEEVPPPDVNSMSTQELCKEILKLRAEVVALKESMKGSMQFNLFMVEQVKHEQWKRKTTLDLIEHKVEQVSLEDGAESQLPEDMRL